MNLVKIINNWIIYIPIVAISKKSMNINLFHILIWLFSNIKQSLEKIKISLYENKFIEVKTKKYINILNRFAPGGWVASHFQRNCPHELF